AAAAVARAVFRCFLQAEAGIRGFHVTGVQTCALPISSRRRRVDGQASLRGVRGHPRAAGATVPDADHPGMALRPPFAQVIPFARSEERRVGEEGGTQVSRRRGEDRAEREAAGEMRTWM